MPVQRDRSSKTWPRAAVILLALILVDSRVGAAEPRILVQRSGTTARLRGLSPVSDRVAWTSGAGGTCLRTGDGGATWTLRPVSGVDVPDLDFRDIHAVDARCAYLLSVGPGAQSRIYKTIDAGATWTRQYTNPDPQGFLDALAFWDADHGMALGDPVGGRFVIVATENGGKTWNPLAMNRMPPALAGEGAFAASGTCLITLGEQSAWFATGGGSHSRVFRSDERGRSWSAHESPVRAGSASTGIFSLAFRDEWHGVAVGGDYKSPDEPAGYVALTTDGGKSWSSPKGPSPKGYRSAVAFIPGTSPPALVAVGLAGADSSGDGGNSWTPLPLTGLHSVGFVAPGVGWGVGEQGAIVRFDWSP